MTAKDALDVGLRYAHLNTRNIYFFAVLAVLFGGWTVLSPDVNETETYADVRKVMAIGYSLLAGSLLLLSLHLTARANAAFKLGAALMKEGAIAELPGAPAVFRGTSILWVLFFMAATIIVVNYIILIYAVDGGLF